ncbi:Cilia- and flagella-associated protein 52 [Cryptotermes secundus]|uniref:Cilia- and flagella-associated protein 52 n=1 Tax=Cryptotermes secundus TaxID=105785 RepID=A0A2J7PK36_9NEOP|nr:Cilia- and flagella-associated protein 52 [Cryptotermes secundus]
MTVVFGCVLGATVQGLNIHPDGLHFVYPLGCKVVVQDWQTKRQIFLSGHTNVVSAIAVSPDGKYIASGQINHMGFKALVILWSFETSQILSKYDIHKVRVESVTFTCDSKHLISLGGRDDSNIIVWNVEKGEAVCGAVANCGTSGSAVLLCRTNLRGHCFITGGEGTLRLWKVIPDRRQLETVDVKFGLIKRHIICIVIDEMDMFAYCGTTTGDVVKVKLNYDSDVNILDPVTNPVLLGCFGKYVGRKKLLAGEEPARYSQGVTALHLWSTNTKCQIIVGGGDGTIELVKELVNTTLPAPSVLRKVKMPSLPQLLVLKSTTVNSAPTSLQMLHMTIFVGTMLSEIFTIDVETFEVKLHVTCHKHAIHDIAFPHEYSEVFATCSKDDIRVWSTETSLELLRITVANFTCTGIQFTCDGKSIISGWNDGEIRAFTPQTGRLIYEIHNAHSKGVTAIAITTGGHRIVSGGGEGQVRVWEIKPTYQKLEGILQEHRGPVSCIRISSSDTEAISASSDGTCVIWDIVRLTRKHSLFANTQFMGVCYHPSDLQVVTTGTDCKIGYWEVYDGSLIREIDGSTSSGLNAIEITTDGEHILTGGNDQYVKVWNYHKGIPTHIGTGHASVITAVRFSPDNRHIISGSSDGGIFQWKSPVVKKWLQESQQSRSHSSRSTRSIGSKQGATEREGEGSSGQVETLDSARSVQGSKGDGTEERKLGEVCTYEEEHVNSVRNIITEGGEGTPKSGNTPKSSGTPKSANTPKSNGTPKSGNTPKSNGTPKSANTPKSNGTPKSGNTPKSNGTPKSGNTLKSNGTPKSGNTPKSNGTPKSNDTPKSGNTLKSNGTPKSGNTLKNNGAPK